MKVECQIKECENNRNGMCKAGEIRIGYAGCLSIKKPTSVSPQY
ncbi:hypothetical protein DRP07_10635 [Archaeoglobales archaeon]|nr:MAG: hypothetical protein DRP07_10635 [Archaeoglobales archaeon]